MPGALKVKVGGTYVSVPRGPKGEPGAAVVAERPATDAPGTYPTGLSLFAVTGTTSATWPGGSTGLVITHLADGQGFQVFHATAGTHYTRTLNGSGWTSWFAPGNTFRIVYNTVSGTWPARPPGASYVEWVGPSVPTADLLDGDTFVNTTG